MLTFSHFTSRGIAHGITQKEDTTPAELVIGEQIHKDGIVWVSEKTSARIPRADALLTKTSGITLGVRTADCVPILFAEPRAGIVGVVHAGWRGTALEITRKAIDALGFAPHRVLVGVGPAICPQCFEVGPEVASQFDRSVTTRQGEKWHVDLWQANVDQLKDAGVPEKNIEVLKVCTYEDPTLFSFRRGDRGEERNIGFIQL